MKPKILIPRGRFGNLLFAYTTRSLPIYDWDPEDQLFGIRRQGKPLKNLGKCFVDRTNPYKKITILLTKKQELYPWKIGSLQWPIYGELKAPRLSRGAFTSTGFYPSGPDQKSGPLQEPWAIGGIYHKNSSCFPFNIATIHNFSSVPKNRHFFRKKGIESNDPIRFPFFTVSRNDHNALFRGIWDSSKGSKWVILGHREKGGAYWRTQEYQSHVIYMCRGYTPLIACNSRRIILLGLLKNTRTAMRIIDKLTISNIC